MLLLNLGVRIAAAVLNVPPDALSFLPMAAPLPSSPAEVARRRASSAALAEAFRPGDGFDTPEEDVLLVDGAAPAGPARGDEGARRRRPSTYGEVTELGARQLFSYMGMAGRAPPPGDDAGAPVTFVDLGSGAGRLVCQAYMEVPRLARAVGVELAPSRHAAADRAWGRLEELARDVRGAGGDGWAGGDAELELVEGDLFGLDVSEATHVYVASLCFTEEMMARLADKLLDECPKLRCAATLRAFPPEAEERLGVARMEFVEMSWTKPRGEGCGVYIYVPLRTATA